MGVSLASQWKAPHMLCPHLSEPRGDALYTQEAKVPGLSICFSPGLSGSVSPTFTRDGPPLVKSLCFRGSPPADEDPQDVALEAEAVVRVLGADQELAA